MSNEKNELKMPPGKYIATVKIGPKGQIVLPKEVRDMFGISPGDSLLLLGDTERGIALNTFDYFNQIANVAFDRSAQTLPETDFANAVRTVTDVPAENPLDDKKEV